MSNYFGPQNEDFEDEDHGSISMSWERDDGSLGVQYEDGYVTLQDSDDNTIYEGYDFEGSDEEVDAYFYDEQ